jgi:hypothetical protein
MERISRRSAMRAASAGAVVVGTAILEGMAGGDEPNAPKLWTLEGELKVHSKYLYRYYLVLSTNRAKSARYTDPITTATRINWHASNSRSASGCAASWGPNTIPAGPMRTRPRSPRRGSCT